MNKNFIIILLVLLYPASLLTYKPNPQASMRNKENINLNNNIYITAAHLGEIEGYTLLYEDADRDVGYYLANDIKLSALSLQHVEIDGLVDCVISETYDGGFTVYTSRPDLIHSGLSGTRVKTKDGQEIGFVSALLQDGKIDCKNLE